MRKGGQYERKVGESVRAHDVLGACGISAYFGTCVRNSEDRIKEKIGTWEPSM